ncbi:MAG TPA: efflux RND transporter permease subunit [Flavobacteriales bacterium]
MLNRLIRSSLENRLFVVAAAALVLVYGTIVITHLPVDVLPDLNRPRVTIFLEANAMAPEEIETQVVLPVELALNGSTGVEVVRSSSTIGIGMVFVEFDWDMDLFKARQIVAERLQTVKLPDGITPVMGPVSSIMGQIMYIGLSADTTSPMELRTLAEFVVRRQIMSIKGVSQVIPMGGERMQYQVLVSTQRLLQFQVSIDDLDAALQQTNANSTGGFFDRYGSEVLIRTIGRAKSKEDLENTVITNREGMPVLLKQVAEVKEGGAVKRGDAGINGKPAVILTVEKQPGVNTVELTNEIVRVCNNLKASLPPDVTIHPEIFQQKNFITNAIDNVKHALRDGFILVILILFLFLLNFRTTIITLTAIPLSILITALVFKLFGISINTLTLGGLAIAIGELVDDAIVDVENVFRRLKENAQKLRSSDAAVRAQAKPMMRVIYEASSEVRNSIVYATIIVVLVFIPLFYLQGIEGRIFIPLGLAYITSIIASLVVSLTVTPALCSYLLTKIKTDEKHQDSAVVRFLKQQDLKLLERALDKPKLVLVSAGLLIIGALAVVPFFGSEFLPPFNEGSFTINVAAPPGTSLEESNRMGTLAEKLIMQVPEVANVSRRTGRAELDEHVEPVSNSEIEVALKDETNRSRDEIIADIRSKLKVIKGASVSVGQPISHRIEHLMTGVRAQVAVKLFGNNLQVLRSTAQEIASAIEEVEGAVDIQVERQTMVPQLLIKVNRESLIRYGIQAGQVAHDLEVFYNGKVVGQILDGDRSFDILLRTNDNERNNIESIRKTLIDTPTGDLIPLEQIATIEYTPAINNITHENAQRKITVSCNVQGADLSSTVEAIKKNIHQKVKLPEGYYIRYDGQYETQQASSQRIFWLSLASLVGIFIVLFSHFHSWRIVLQIMLNIPLALVGSVIAVMLTGGVFSVATLVGFITLTGIASRNGIMMISHYIHLIEQEGEEFNRKMILRGSLERLVPVLMTALVAALALIPLTLDPQAAGKEILYPVAIVILGGLVSSTLLDIVVTPVVFSLFGKQALEDYFKKKKTAKILSMDSSFAGI